MREQLRVVAAAVMPPEILAQGTSPWVDAVANLSAATVVSWNSGSSFRPGCSAFPQGTISQERPGAVRHECVTRAGPIAAKWDIWGGSLLARRPSTVRHARVRGGAQSGGESGRPL